MLQISEILRVISPEILEGTPLEVPPPILTKVIPVSFQVMFKGISPEFAPENP